MSSLNLAAPAKINYLLDVIGKRPDGYHELRMIMQRINLCDDITLSVIRSPGISVTCNSPGAPDGPDNIAWKAARAILDRSKSEYGVHISITKNIPVAAGLGGGSSDAAAVLSGLNELLCLDLSIVELMDMGCRLGADVPFFILNTTALAEGIGEILTPLPDMPKCWILLVNPRIQVSTAWVYQSLQLTSRKELNKLPKFFSSIEQITSIMSNDLETVTIRAFPVIEAIKRQMTELGALGSMMSGSGPTVFGVFNDFDTAERARQKITSGDEWFAVTVETL